MLMPAGTATKRDRVCFACPTAVAAAARSPCTEAITVRIELRRLVDITPYDKNPKMMRGLSCEGDWECATFPKQSSTLRRVDQKSCVWDDDPVYRCRTRKPSDPNEPVEVNECPPNPNP